MDEPDATEEVEVEETPSEKTERKVVRNAIDLQRIKLEKLMKNPEKPIIIPETPKEKDFVYSVPTFVRNVMGSSAGAGSGEFHVYRNLRRKEYARQKMIEVKGYKESLDQQYRDKIEKNRLEAEAKTAKKRAKRLKRKEKQKMNKKIKKSLDPIQDDIDEHSDESENSNDENEQKENDNNTDKISNEDEKLECLKTEKETINLDDNLSSIRGKETKKVEEKIELENQSEIGSKVNSKSQQKDAVIIKEKQIETSVSKENTLDKLPERKTKPEEEREIQSDEILEKVESQSTKNCENLDMIKNGSETESAAKTEEFAS
ncbi:uncharacterized protein F37A4.2 [Condylostylus longicornis]|uniref:uncharacterized protein F37A4.2 n=1 Tax=Condylostylus longicornis TaxID=2530218 RepID=UPI00244E0FE7|nr:uncharacterized protein F37A4.2 [Condylostylus longicornis]